MAISIGLGFNYLQIKSSFDFFSPKQENELTITNSQHAIRVALLLDTSGSMDGLIEQAKSQLWNILNELARTEKNGQEPTLEIALYEYGNPAKGGNDQINQLTAFTTDMDLVSDKLFALTTNGGEEYCGLIIQTSLNELKWEATDGDLKIIYIAGNEPFTQGPVNYAYACKQAKQKDITVNTIFCGSYQEGISGSWQTGAALGGGIYMHIDPNQQTVYVETPYDADINKLNNKLNDTYIPYGQKGQEKQQSQVTQDYNAGQYSMTNSADRVVFKSSKKYKATDWDLIDAYKKDKRILKNASNLPSGLQNISTEEMENRIQVITIERENIQKQIQDLDQKRRTFKEKQTKEVTEGSLQDSMLKSIQEQAKKKGFEIKK